MSEKEMNLVCFGEVLWDVFPDKRLLGGAPLNVAMRLQSLGANTHIVSSVGKDELGEKALEEITSAGIAVNTINKLSGLPTGTVTVTLEDGIPSYTIDQPVAWDRISINEFSEAVITAADAIVFGSLALRGEFNLNTLRQISNTDSKSVFDINLRKPFYNDELIKELVSVADILKLNDEELEYVIALFKLKSTTLEDQLRELSVSTATPTICVTLGSEGAVLYHENELFRHSGYAIKVADTVGAGDSFLAGLLFALFSGKTANHALDLACALGALVASKPGANCVVTPGEIKEIQG